MVHNVMPGGDCFQRQQHPRLLGRDHRLHRDDVIRRGARRRNVGRGGERIRGSRTEVNEEMRLYFNINNNCRKYKAVYIYVMLSLHRNTFLTFRRRLPVQGSGYCRPFHFSRSVAHSSLIFQAFRSLLIVSFHRNFGLPLGRFPSIFISATARMFSVSPLLLTSPNHSSLLRLITVAIASTFASSKISSFLLCSNRLTPIAHRTILISVVAIRFSSLTDIGHEKKSV